MKDRTEVEDVAMTIVPMITATLSLVASVAIIDSIRRSKKKLKDAYRRILFGMSFYDILASLTGTLVIFQSTPEANTWLPLGNQTSCNILSLMRVVGMVGMAQYAVSLNIYYYYLIKQNMREETFRKKIEPWIHGLPIIWGLSWGIYIWVIKAFNPSPIGECLIADYPLNCSKNDDVECIRGQNFFVPIVFFTFTIISSLIITVSLLIVIWCKVRRQEIRMDRYRIRRISSIMDERLNERAGGGMRDWYRRFQRNRRTPSNARVFLYSAFWYTLAFFATFFFSYVAFIRFLMGLENPFFLRIIARAMQPLQGLFNILIYTRPHVAVCRQKNPEWTWFQAFRHIIASGGDDDLDPNERRRRSRTRAGRQRSSTASYSSLRSMGSEHGRRRSSLGADIADNAPPRVMSMFGPLRTRGSNRGDLFHANTNEHKVRRETTITRAGDDLGEPDEGSDPSLTGGRREDNTKLSIITEDRQLLDDADIDIDIGDDSIEVEEEKGRDDKTDIVLVGSFGKIEDGSRIRSVRFSAS